MLSIACFVLAGAFVSCGKSDSPESISKTEKHSFAASTTVGPETQTNVKGSGTAISADEVKQRAKENMSRIVDEAREKNDSLSKSNIPCDKDAEEALRGFLESACKGDKDKAVSYLYPQGILDSAQSSITDNFANTGAEGSELTALNITECSRLAPDTGYAAAEKYFSTAAENNGIEDLSVTVNDGYCIRFTFTSDIGGEISTESPEAVLVCLEGEGWKVIPLGISDIMEIVGNID